MDPYDPDWLYYPLRFVRYGISGLWIGLGAPWLFSKIHLSETAVPPRDDEVRYGKVH